MCFVYCYQGMKTLRVDAVGYYTSVKSINILNIEPHTIIFKLTKDERIFNLPRMMFIVLTGI